MKKMNKFLSLLLAIVMVLSLAVTGFAADDSYKIVIKNVENANYLYEAFQIFAGTLSVDEHGVTTLSDITWGSALTEENQGYLMTALKELEIDGVKPFAACENASDVAKVLGQNTSKDNKVAVEFAKTVGAVHNNNGTLVYLSNPSPSSTYDATAKTATITVTAPGYYMVRNHSVPKPSEEREASYTRYMLEVVHDVEVTHKGEVPTVDKSILGYDYQVDADGNPILDSDGNPIPKVDADGNPIVLTRTDESQAAIGDTIVYEIVGTLPGNIDDYDTYYYEFDDIMSPGLTFTPDSGKVTVNGVDVTDYFSAVVEPQSDGRTYLRVGIQDLKALSLLTTDAEGNPLSVGPITKDTKVVVTYKAVLNEKALVTGEKNTVELTYSNNPNWDGEGSTTPPPPGPTPPSPIYPTGVTPPSEVVTYTTQITITKKDDSNRILTGAAFKITGTSLNRVVTTGEIFVLDDAGTWYKLLDGTYVEKAPVFFDPDTTDDVDPVDYLAYDPTYFVGDIATDPTTVTAKAFVKVPTTTIEYVETQVDYESFVNADSTDSIPDGTLTLYGLGEGTYTITETVTPTGYNTIEPFQITITWKGGDKWEYTGTDFTDANGNGKYDEGEVFTNNVTVINRAGATLPSTGGMGTTIFYGLGSVLVLAAVVLLVSKKRMAYAE